MTRAIRFLPWIACACLAAACGDNHEVPRDAAPDAAPEALAPCVDRPTDLPRPPTGALPCDLLPPGFVAPR